MKGLIIILMTSVLVNNYVLVRFLGICPFLGVSKKLNQAFGMGVAVTFVMVFATLVTWPIYYYLLAPNYTYLQTIVFILVIAALVQFVEIVLKKFIPSLHKSLGVYLPLITTNCIVLAVTIPLMLLTIIILIASALPRFSRLQTKIDKLNSTVQENVTNVRVVKSFVREEFEFNKFKADNGNLKASSISATKLMIVLMPIMNLFMYITIIITVANALPILLTKDWQAEPRPVFLKPVFHSIKSRQSQTIANETLLITLFSTLISIFE